MDEYPTLTVKELIERLQRLPESAEVYGAYDAGFADAPVVDDWFKDGRVYLVVDS